MKEELRKIRNALVSVYYKEHLDKVVHKLDQLGVNIYSTGGTYKFIQDIGINAVTIESLTSYPGILGGRVKTLHPKVFGGILYRRNNKDDIEQTVQYDIPPFDLVIVDLYPFEETVMRTSDETEIIEKIDIGGISLIRAAAKNYYDVLTIPSSAFYEPLLALLEDKKGHSSLADRKYFATQAFCVTSHYDTMIFNHFNKGEYIKAFKKSILQSRTLRYGENPHQEGLYYGDLDKVFKQLHGKEISYNNLGDLDAGINLIAEFNETTVAILKHTNACGVACRSDLTQAWHDALAGDPVSAFGGVIISNHEIDKTTAEQINKLFFEIILAPAYKKDALEILQSKKNRIILQQKMDVFASTVFRSLLGGVIEQTKDDSMESVNDLKTVTNTLPNERETQDMIFGNKIVKHTKSNAIVLAKNKQLLGSGVGQTSRVDALKQAIAKATDFGFDLQGAVMASDAFFPFADSVEIAHQAGITAIIQPGGSIRDQESMDYCNAHNLTMVFTGVRHFKH